MSCSTYESTTLSSHSLDDLIQMAVTSLEVDPAATRPSRILFPIDLGLEYSKEYEALLEQFTAALENLVGAKVEPINLTAIWDESPPLQAKGMSMQGYMKKVSRILRQR